MPHAFQLVIQFPEVCSLSRRAIRTMMAEAVGNPDGDASLPHLVAGVGERHDDALFQLWLADKWTIEQVLTKAEDPAGLGKRIVAERRGDSHDRTLDEACPANCFIHTEAPEAAFSLCRDVLRKHGLLNHVTAAWCNLAESEYQTIWPEDFYGPFTP